MYDAHVIKLLFIFVLLVCLWPVWSLGPQLKNLRWVEEKKFFSFPTLCKVTLIMLPNKGDVFHSTCQEGEAEGEHLQVVPTFTIPPGGGKMVYWSSILGFYFCQKEAYISESKFNLTVLESHLSLTNCDHPFKPHQQTDLLISLDSWVYFWNGSKLMGSWEADVGKLELLLCCQTAWVQIQPPPLSGWGTSYSCYSVSVTAISPCIKWWHVATYLIELWWRLNIGYFIGLRDWNGC